MSDTTSEQFNTVLTNIIDREIYCLDNSVVELLFRHDELTFDDIENESVDIDSLTWDVWIVGNSFPGCLPDSDPTVCATWKEAIECMRDELDRTIDSLDDESDSDQIAELETLRDSLANESEGEFSYTTRDRHWWVSSDIMGTDDIRTARWESSYWTPFDSGFICREDYSDESELQHGEVMQWWRVSDWLVARIREHNGIVIESDYGNWWGRTSYGCGLDSEPILRSIAENIVR